MLGRAKHRLGASLSWYWFIALGLAAAVNGQNVSYEIDLSDTVRPGQVFAIAADATVRDTVSYSQNGVPGFVETTDQVLALVGRVTVLEVDDLGRLKSARLGIERLQGAANGNPLIKVPEDVELSIRVEAGQPLITFAAGQNKEEPEWLTGWRPTLLLLLGMDTAKASLQTVYGPTRRIAVGESWVADPAKVATRIGQIGLSLPPDGVVQAEGRLLRVSRLDGAPAAQVRIKTVLNQAQPAAAAAADWIRLAEGTMTLTRERIGLLDETGPPRQSTVEMISDMVYVDEGGVESRRESSMRRVVQWTPVQASP